MIYETFLISRSPCSFSVIPPISRALRSEGRQLISCRDKPQRHAVVTPPLSGRWRPIVEHVTLVTSAARAVVFDSRQDQFVIALGVKATRDRFVEAGPSRPAVELGVRVEKCLVAGRANIGTL